jgi:hypothetical protein
MFAGQSGELLIRVVDAHAGHPGLRLDRSLRAVGCFVAGQLLVSPRLPGTEPGVILRAPRHERSLGRGACHRSSHGVSQVRGRPHRRRAPAGARRRADPLVCCRRRLGHDRRRPRCGFGAGQSRGVGRGRRRRGGGRRQRGGDGGRFDCHLGRLGPDVRWRWRHRWGRRHLFAGLFGPVGPHRLEAGQRLGRKSRPTRWLESRRARSGPLRHGAGRRPPRVRSLARLGSPAGLGPRGDGLRGAARLERPARAVWSPETWQGIAVASRGVPPGWALLLGADDPPAEMRAGALVWRGGRAPGRGVDLVPDPGHADGGVEESGDAGLFPRCGVRGGRIKVRRVPPAVRREPPSDALEVVAQSTPHLSRTARSSVASETSQRGACVRKDTRPAT